MPLVYTGLIGRGILCRKQHIFLFIFICIGTFFVAAFRKLVRPEMIGMVLGKTNGILTFQSKSLEWLDGKFQDIGIGPSCAVVIFIFDGSHRSVYKGTIIHKGVAFIHFSDDRRQIDRTVGISAAAEYSLAHILPLVVCGNLQCHIKP